MRARQVPLPLALACLTAPLLAAGHAAAQGGLDEASLAAPTAAAVPHAPPASAWSSTAPARAR